MKKKTQRIIVIVVAAALLLSVMVPVLSVFARASVTQNDIQNIKSELSDIQAQKKDAEARLKAIRNDLSKAKEHELSKRSCFSKPLDLEEGHR